MMQKLWRGTLFLIFLLAITIGVRTVRFPSRQVPPAPVPLDWDTAPAERRLARAIQFQTVSPQAGPQGDMQAFANFIGFLEQAFPRVHRHLTRERVNRYSLLFHWPGPSGPKPILFLAHMDVVPVEPQTESQWRHPPFSGRQEGGYIWGRGTLDDKVGVLSLLEAVEKLLAEGFQPPQSLYLAFGHDEETGGREGAAHIAEQLARRHPEFAYILDEGLVIARDMLPLNKPVALIGIAEKGYLTLKLSARGNSGHSSTPPQYSAPGILSRALVKLEEHPLPGRLRGPGRLLFEYIGPEMPLLQRLVFANLWLFAPLVERQLAQQPATNALIRTTTAITMLQGSPKENILPSEAQAMVNFRLLPGDSIQAVLNQVKKTISDDRIQVIPNEQMMSEASAQSPLKGPVFQLLQATLAQVAPEAVVAPSLVLAGTDSRHYAHLSPYVYRFRPWTLGPEDLARVHGINERLAVADYARCIQFYYQLIRNSHLR